MTWDPVPWMIGGGAVHSVNVARNLAHIAAQGRQGIITPTDCEIRELATPGSSVQMYPGTIAIANRAPSARDEMFVGRCPTTTTVPIAATTSAGKRSDLIVARVENPFSGDGSWAAPANPQVGPYIFTRVISNVSATTLTAAELGLGQSMVELARIDLPASTSKITQAMIKDLRPMSSVFSQREYNLTSVAAKSVLTATAFANWPAESNLAVSVPEWATHVKMRAILSGINYGKSGVTTALNVWGQLRVAFVGATSTRYSSPSSFNESTGGGTDRASFMAGGTNVPVTPGCRGKQATIRIEGQKDGGNADLWVDLGAMVSIEAEFVRLGESNV